MFSVKKQKTEKNNNNNDNTNNNNTNFTNTGYQPALFRTPTPLKLTNEEIENSTDILAIEKAIETELEEIKNFVELYNGMTSDYLETYLTDIRRKKFDLVGYLDEFANDLYQKVAAGILNSEKDRMKSHLQTNHFLTTLNQNVLTWTARIRDLKHKWVELVVDESRPEVFTKVNDLQEMNQIINRYVNSNVAEKEDAWQHEFHLNSKIAKQIIEANDPETILTAIEEAKLYSLTIILELHINESSTNEERIKNINDSHASIISRVQEMSERLISMQQHQLKISSLPEENIGKTNYGINNS